MNLSLSIDIFAGGPGSGCNPRKGSCGRPKTKDAEKSKKAKESHKPSSWAHTLLSDQNQNELAKVIKAQPTTHLAAFDIIDKKRGLGIEVKTLITQKNDKLTQHPASWRRKVLEAKKLGLKNIVTVAFDDRPGKNSQVYYRLGVGSFDLHTMTPVDDLRHLARELSKVHDTEKFGKSYGSFNVKRRK